MESSDLKPNRHKVQKALARTPRFLFRSWSSRSGGHAALNTETAITPPAFYNDSDQDSLTFYGRTCDDLNRVATMHLTMGRNRPTYFSSWSQSLCHVLSTARDTARRYPDCKTYISVLDTDKLDEDAVILHTSDLKSIIRGMFSDFPHEYLAHGKIQSPAYATVPLAEIENAGLAYFNPSLIGAGHAQQSGELQAGLAAAQRIADLFPDDLQVVVQAYLLAVKAEEHHDEIVDALKDFNIPESWFSDAKLTSELNMHGSVDAARALATINDLIALKTPDTISRSTIQSRRSMEKLEQERRDNTLVGAVWKQFSGTGSEVTSSMADAIEEEGQES